MSLFAWTLLPCDKTKHQTPAYFSLLPELCLLCGLASVPAFSLAGGEEAGAGGSIDLINFSLCSVCAKNVCGE